MKLKPENDVVAQLSRALGAIRRPDDYFDGLKLRSTLCPDNILLFKRLDTPDFRPGEVTDNFHHRFELLIVLERGGTVSIGESRYRLEPGEAALLFPNQFHHYMDVEQGPIKWLFVTFELNSEAAVSALRDSPRVLPSAAWDCLLSLVREYNRKASEQNVLAISYHLSELLSALVSSREIPASRCDIQKANTARDQVLEKINVYVRRNFSEAPTLQRLAEELGYSESHLRAIFKNELGISLGRYIRNSRLSHASQLLQKGDIAIAEVATLSGFDSAFAFSRAFKNVYGVTPKAYSKRFHSTA